MVKFGVGLPIFSGGSALTRSIQFGAMEKYALRAEELGYDSLWAADHLVLGGQDGELEVWTALSALAMKTRRIRLGTLVLCNSHRNPALLAKMAATLDYISGGRLDLGMGAGWYKAEQEAYGLGWVESARTRIEMMEEAIELMKALFTQGQVSFQGRYYQVKDAVCQPRPVQKPWPRLWIGGAGEKVLLRAAAKHADGWNIPTISAEEYGHKLQVLREHCQAVGRDYGEIVKSLECVGMVVEGQGDMERVVDWAYARRGESRNVPTAAERDKLARELREKYLLGDLEQCRQEVARYVEAGVEYFMVYFLDYPSTRSLELFAREVAPQFKG